MCVCKRERESGGGRWKIVKEGKRRKEIVREGKRREERVRKGKIERNSQEWERERV